MDEIISFLMKSILPALLGTGASFGMSQLLSPHQGGSSPQGASPTPAMGQSSSMPGTEGLVGAGSTVKPAVGNFMGGTTGASPGISTAPERPVSSGFTTLTPNPMRQPGGLLNRNIVGV